VSQISWWASRARRFSSHVRARVTADEVVGLEAWTSPAQRTLFLAMPVGDQRHGLDVVAHLRADGVDEPEVLVAGLLHDAGKGPSVRAWHRIAWSLGEHYGPGALAAARRLPGFGPPLDRMRDHAELSAGMAAEAGCTERTVDLIRHQAEPRDPRYGALLKLADDAC
jgi:hypothetical protein